MSVGALPTPDGVRLFEARAAASGVGVPASPSVLTELVEVLEGVPLAIECAAAQAAIREKEGSPEPGRVATTV